MIHCNMVLNAIRICHTKFSKEFEHEQFTI